MPLSHPSMPHLNKSSEQSLNQPETPVFTVAPPDDDETLFQQQMQQMEEAEKQMPGAIAAQETKTADPLIQKEVEKKIALEKLLFLRQEHFKEFEYSGLKFKFKLLKSEDNAEIIDAMQAIKNDEVYRASIMGLAATLVSVNDTKLENFYNGPEQLDKPLVRKYYELCKWPTFLVNLLQTYSIQLQGEVEKEFSKDFLKK